MTFWKKIFALLILTAAALAFCGCNYDHELKNLDILTAVGIDKAKDRSQYDVYAQVLKADRAVEESYGESYRYFKGVGYDIPSAVETIYNQGSGELAFAHNKLYLFSHDATKNMTEMRGVLLGDIFDIRPQSYCAVVKNDMSYFMASVDEYGFDCCYKLLQLLKETDNVPTVSDLLGVLSDEGKTILIPEVEVQNGVVGISKWLVVDINGVQSMVNRVYR